MGGSDDSVSPERAGRYEFVEALSGASLGSLWRARVLSGSESGRIVVVRRIPRAGLDAESVRRLTEAGFAAMEVRHPKVAAALDVVVSENEICLVSELVEGFRLRALLPGGGSKARCPPEVALRIALDVLEAIVGVGPRWREITEGGDDAVIDGAVHGGLHPDAVLLPVFGEAMITDVGVTGVAMTVPTLRDAPSVLAYRAPEQVSERGDGLSDVFSLGVILYELIAHRPLFAPLTMPRPGGARAISTTADVNTVKRKLASASIAPLATLPLLRGTLLEGVSELVARAVVRDRSARFESLEAMIEAIRALGPAALADHEAVARFVSKVTGVVSEPPSLLGVVNLDSDPAVSNRPTVPPEGTPAPSSVSVLAVHGPVEPVPISSVDASPQGAEPSDHDRVTTPGPFSEKTDPIGNEPVAPEEPAFPAPASSRAFTSPIADPVEASTSEPPTLASSIVPSRRGPILGAALVVSAIAGAGVAVLATRSGDAEPTTSVKAATPAPPAPSRVVKTVPIAPATAAIDEDSVSVQKTERPDGSAHSVEKAAKEREPAVATAQPVPSAGVAVPPRASASNPSAAPTSLQDSSVPDKEPFRPSGI